MRLSMKISPKVPSRETNIQDLPSHLLRYIFTYYVHDLPSLFHIRTICGVWKQLIKDSLHWIALPLTIEAPRTYRELIKRVLDEYSLQSGLEYFHFLNTTEELPLLSENFQYSAKVSRIEILREDSSSTVVFQESTSSSDRKGKQKKKSRPSTPKTSRSSLRMRESETQPLEYLVIQAYETQSWFLPLFNRYHRLWREHVRRDEALRGWRAFYSQWEGRVKGLCLVCLAIIVYGFHGISTSQPLTLTHHLMFVLAYAVLVLDSLLFLKPCVLSYFRFDQRVLLCDDLSLSSGSSRTILFDIASILIFRFTALLSLLLVQIKLSQIDEELSWLQTNIPLWIGNGLVLGLRLYNSSSGLSQSRRRKEVYQTEEAEKLEQSCGLVFYGVLMLNFPLAIFFNEIFFSCQQHSDHATDCYYIPKEVLLFSSLLCLLPVFYLLIARKVSSLSHCLCYNETEEEEEELIRETEHWLWLRQGWSVAQKTAGVVATGLSVYCLVVLCSDLVQENSEGLFSETWSVAQVIAFLVLTIHVSVFSDSEALEQLERRNRSKGNLILS